MPETSFDDSPQPRSRVKVSFNLPSVDIDALKEIAEARDTTVTEALRGAIATEHFFRQAVKNGEKILLEASDGRVREIVFL